MHLIEICFHRIHEGDIQTILPDTGAAPFVHAMFVPGAIGGEDKIIAPQGHLVPINDGIGPAAFHDEAQGGGGMAMRRGPFARMHDLQTGI